LYQIAREARRLQPIGVQLKVVDARSSSAQVPVV
jgi:hypothetical protein